MRYIQKFRKHFSARPVFTIRDAKFFLSELGASKEYQYLLISNLLKKGEIKKIKKGAYTFGIDPSIANFAFSPSYHGLQDALSLLDLWDQETNTIIITPLKVRIGVREILGGKVFVRRIDRSMFFGFDSIRYFDYILPVSDVEKTLIDFVYFKEPLPNTVLKEMKKKIDKGKLNGYLDRCSKFLKRRVLSVFGSA